MPPAVQKTPVLFCMSITPFGARDCLDEAALRVHLRRMAAAGVAVYLGSPGAGEGHVLTDDELRRVYEIGVEELKGKVPVYATGFEPRSARALAPIAAIAAIAGIEAFQVYPLDGGHGMRPTPQELERYFSDALDAVNLPALISVHVAVGYVVPIETIQRLLKVHEHIVGINCMGTGTDYLVRLLDAVGARVKLYTHIDTALTTLPLGAAGCLAAEPNIAPRLCQSLFDHYAAGDIQAAGEALRNITRLANIVNKHAPSTARWAKMGLKVLGLPGGTLRRPYLLPGEEAQRDMALAFQRMGLAKLEGLASP